MTSHCGRTVVSRPLEPGRFKPGAEAQETRKSVTPYHFGVMVANMTLSAPSGHLRQGSICWIWRGSNDMMAQDWFETRRTKHLFELHFVVFDL